MLTSATLVYLYNLIACFFLGVDNGLPVVPSEVARNAIKELESLEVEDHLKVETLFDGKTTSKVTILIEMHEMGLKASCDLIACLLSGLEIYILMARVVNVTIVKMDVVKELESLPHEMRIRFTRCLLNTLHFDGYDNIASYFTLLRLTCSVGIPATRDLMVSLIVRKLTWEEIYEMETMWWWFSKWSPVDPKFNTELYEAMYDDAEDYPAKKAVSDSVKMLIETGAVYVLPLV